MKKGTYAYDNERYKRMEMSAAKAFGIRTPMNYLKTYREIQRERHVRRLKKDLLFFFGILGFLVVLGLMGGWTRCVGNAGC